MTGIENIIKLHDERFIWDEGSAFIVFTVFAVLTGLSFFPCICFGVADALREKGGKWASRPALVGLLFWFVGFTLMAVYCRKLDINIKHEYYGLMRTTGYSLREYTDSHDCGGDKCYRRFVAVDLDVDWGYAWACPSAPQTQCQQPITNSCKYKICGATRCSDLKTDLAFEKAIACAETYFSSDVNYTQYERGSGPSQDLNWPSVLAYGDCQSCSARLSVPEVDKLRMFKILGATFFFAGLTLFVLAIACLVPWRQLAFPFIAPRKRTQNDGKPKPNAPDDRDIETEEVEKPIDATNCPSSCEAPKAGNVHCAV